MKHTISDLYQMQGMSLTDKVKMTKRRIAEWVDEFGIDGVYVSFSGGKDSTVLLTIARQMYPDIKAVFVDTGLEYPEIRQFVKTWDNVDWVKPKMSFKQVIEKYGYPFISKEVAECVYGARRYLTSVLERESLDRQTDRQTDLPYLHQFTKLTGTGIYSSGRNSQRQADMGSCQTSRNVTNWGGGQVKRFSDLMGIRTVDNRVDARLWKGYRQFSDTTSDGNTPDEGQSDKGEYP